MGASLGNSAVWILTKGTGAIERVFLNEVAQSLVGTFSLRYGARARSVSADIREHTAEHPSASYSGLFAADGSRTFEIHPAYQRVRFRLASVFDVSETTFLPLGSGDPGHEDPALVYVVVEIHNRDEFAHRVRVTGSAMLRGSTRPDIRTRYDENSHALVATNASQPQWVRIVGLSERPTKYGCDFDFGGTYDPSHLHDLSNDTSIEGDVLGRLQYDVTVKAGARCELCFKIGVYAAGEAEALRHFNDAQGSSRELQRSISHLEEVLQHATVLTPDAVINHGALWSKVNMRRVMATYPGGCAFTNDPGTYANVVVRDCAWFIFGNDHFLPSFSRDLLENLAARQYADGKLPEYFDAVSARVEDDGLNINDDTPLYILAVNHHFRATGDLTWLSKVYSSIARAARYILSQVDERGLVFCSANDPRGEVWAIAGWRNIIEGYSINGAVTEINAECVAALRAASHLADNLGSLEQDKTDFSEAAGRIMDAMDRHLINPENGLYYLNIDPGGNPHTDVTGDQIFPVVMRACKEETGFLIISRLNGSDFWTPAGLRTVSRLDPRYDPAAYSGLLGGVWPGLTWWYAFGAARYHPEFMVRALRSSFEHYGAAPRRYNTVPGQFGEWFDGESLVNHGMRLSPWEPPRYLWAAVEGVCGVMLTPGPPRINPLIPAHWSWVGLRQLPYQGAFLSFFLVREAQRGFRIYSTGNVDSDWDVALYHRDVSDNVSVFADSAVVIALERDDGLAILIGNTGDLTVHTPITIHQAGTSPASRFLLRTYNSERGDWEPGGVLSMPELRGLALSIEAGGFRLMELSLEA
ncbi:MAG TPA: amylo-alpha-1,6-glucosidase [Candidatus Cybelea sp.]|jgi:hypothetical protein|nr:amylo-alpha-1,6-glucosidase [Candidatus Cybelea sp.]